MNHAQDKRSCGKRERRARHGERSEETSISENRRSQGSDFFHSQAVFVTRFPDCIMTINISIPGISDRIGVDLR